MALWLYLLAYGCGLATAPYLPVSAPLLALPPLCFLLFIFLRRHRLGWGPLVLFFWALGLLLYHHHDAAPTAPDHIRQFADRTPVSLFGTVLTLAPRYPDGTTLDLRAERLIRDGRSHAVQGKLRLAVDTGSCAIVPGQRIAFRSRLRTPRAYGTPGEFDYPRHLAAQGIFATAFLPDHRGLVGFAAPETNPSGTIGRLRLTLGQRIDTAVAPPWNGLVRALVIGDKGRLSPEQKRLLAAGGVAHLFAISGLHLGLVAALLLVVANFLYRRSEYLLLRAPARRLLPVLLLPLLFGYLLLSGEAVATWRAFAMGTAATLLLFSARQTPPLKLLASCALIFLLIEPLLLFQPGFQLSFAGLCGILLWVPRWQPRLARVPGPLRYLTLLALTTLAATLATTPLVLFNFHLLAPAGLFANLFAVPAIGLLAVPLGLSGALLCPAWPAAAEWLLQGAAAIIRLTLAGVEQLLHVPGLGAQTLYLSPLQLLGATLLCGAIFLAGRGKRHWWLGGSVALAALLLLAGPVVSGSGLRIIALSVGQGDATLLSFDGRQHILVDGGGSHDDRFDPGERLVAPALGRLGIKALEAVVLTHDHPDHRQGLLSILEHFPVRAFWSAQAPEELNPQLAELLAKRGIPQRQAPPGWSPMTGLNSGRLELFVPDQTAPNLNNRSLVVLAAHGRDAALLPGDLEEEGVRQLLAQPPSTAVTLLKLPHHGSRKCLPDRLFDTLAPQLAFASLGWSNPHRFPHPEILSALEQRHIPCWRTDRDGTLQFRSDGQGWQATHWNQRLFR